MNTADPLYTNLLRPIVERIMQANDIGREQAFAFINATVSDAMGNLTVEDIYGLDEFIRDMVDRIATDAVRTEIENTSARDFYDIDDVVRDNLYDLEMTVSDTERRMDEAESEIESLRAEIATLRAGKRSFWRSLFGK